MIYNRSNDDVKKAKEIILQKIQSSQDITESERDILEKGTLTINSINRIETKQAQLMNEFNSMGYYNALISSKQWSAGEIFDEEDLNRIFNNNVILRKAFFTFKSTPLDAVPKYYYEEFNRLEKILEDLEIIASEIAVLYRECGNAWCGG